MPLDNTGEIEEEEEEEEADDEEYDPQEMFNAEFRRHKNHYYMDKMKYTQVTK